MEWATITISEREIKATHSLPPEERAQKFVEEIQEEMRQFHRDNISTVLNMLAPYYAEGAEQRQEHRDSLKTMLFGLPKA